MTATPMQLFLTPAANVRVSRRPAPRALLTALLALGVLREAAATPAPPSTDGWRLESVSREAAREVDGIVRLPTILGGARPEPLLVTLKRAAGAGTDIIRYQTPGCGERFDLADGTATLGCPPPAAGTPMLPAVLSLESMTPTAGLEHTRITLGPEPLTTCISASCAARPDVGVVLLPSDAGHRLRVTTGRPVSVECHQIVFELARGTLSLATSRRGGGVYRMAQLIEATLDGEASFRNGQLLFSGRPQHFAINVALDLHSNDGTELSLTLGPPAAALRWIEIDGRYRRADDLELQRRFDRVAPDPSTSAAAGLPGAMQRLAEEAFKASMRFLRPQGELVLQRREVSQIGPGLSLSRLAYSRQTAAAEVVGVGSGEIEVVGLVADADRFSVALRAPCATADAVATINGGTRKLVADAEALLPDAGLVISGRVVGQLRVNPWYANLVVDRQGEVKIEPAASFFARQGFGDSVLHLLQGAFYVRDRQNVRRFGDNPEVNWRSAIGKGRGPNGDTIIIAHTLLPRTNVEALTAYGRGLTQYEMAALLLGLGATDALVLDGGPSATFKLGAQISSGGLRPEPMCVALEARRLDATAAVGAGRR